jgi:hypothetical protein
LTTCVGYDDILALTLPRNLHHFNDYLVVTSLDDERTAQLVSTMPGVRLFRTDAFTRGGDRFNKGRAIEEAFDILGRWGWILLLDADIVLPPVFAPGPLDQETIYGVQRRQSPDASVDIDGDWANCDLWSSAPTYGYFQLFHADAEVLRSRPWYPTGWGHAGDSDGEFTRKFSANKVLEGSVLHIGLTEKNWCGRATPRLDGQPVPEADENQKRMIQLTIDRGW